MKSIYSVSLFLLILFAACKKDPNAAQAEGAQNGVDTSAQADPADSAFKMSAGHDYTFLTHQVFKINGSFVPGKEAKDQVYKDQWVDLEPGGTFKWGKGKDVLYTGNWGYNHNEMLLRLIPDNGTDKSTQWSVKYNDQMMLWVGSRDMDNHGIQLQLIRTDTL